jgi:hypothetical protein
VWSIGCGSCWSPKIQRLSSRLKFRVQLLPLSNFNLVSACVMYFASETTAVARHTSNIFESSKHRRIRVLQCLCVRSSRTSTAMKHACFVGVSHHYIVLYARKTHARYMRAWSRLWYTQHPLVCLFLCMFSAVRKAPLPAAVQAPRA